MKKMGGFSVLSTSVDPTFVGGWSEGVAIVPPIVWKKLIDP